MAVVFDAAADQLTRTTGVPTLAASTIMAWLYPISPPGTITGALQCGVTSDFRGGGPGSAGRLNVWNGSGVVAGTAVWTNNTWGHATITTAGTGAGGMLGYTNGVLDITTQATTLTFTNVTIGLSPGGDVYNGRVAAVKVWNGVLTADEIKAEMRSYVPVRALNLLTWHPMFLHTDLAQYGATWTANGTLTTADGPPIAWSVRTPSRIRRAAAVAATVFPPHAPVIVSQAVQRAVQV